MSSAAAWGACEGGARIGEGRAGAPATASRPRGPEPWDRESELEGRDLPSPDLPDKFWLDPRFENPARRRGRVHAREYNFEARLRVKAELERAKLAESLWYATSQLVRFKRAAEARGLFVPFRAFPERPPPLSWLSDLLQDLGQSRPMEQPGGP